jgi:hypothetical protein
MAMPAQSQAHRATPRNEVAALLLLFLVAVDCLATVMMLRTQRGLELNPIMDWLYGQGEMYFLFGKMLLTSLAVAWLLRRARRREQRLVLLVGFAIYAPIVGLHILNGAIIAQALTFG